jgi:hypothetical protein
VYATHVIPHFPPNFDQVDPAPGAEHYRDLIDILYKSGGVSLEKYKELQSSFDTTKARWMTLALGNEVMHEVSLEWSNPQKIVDLVEKAASGSWYN